MRNKCAKLTDAVFRSTAQCESTNKQVRAAYWDSYSLSSSSSSQVVLELCPGVPVLQNEKPQPEQWPGLSQFPMTWGATLTSHLFSPNAQRESTSERRPAPRFAAVAAAMKSPSRHRPISQKVSSIATAMK